MNELSMLDLGLKVGSVLGLPGLMLVVWYFSDKSHQRTLAQYREDTQRQMLAHSQALGEVRQMYIDNVELVRGYQKIASGLQDLIVLSTQTMTRLCDKVDGNQFCPQVRLKKQAEGRVE